LIDIAPSFDSAEVWPLKPAGALLVMAAAPGMAGPDDDGIAAVAHPPTALHLR
jgi:hypothetical protein